MRDHLQPEDKSQEPISPEEAIDLLSTLASVFSVAPSMRASDITAEKDDSPQEPGSESPHRIEAKYRTLVEQIPAVVFMAFMDEGMTEAYVSPQIEILLGFSQEEWMNDPVRWYWQIHPDDRERWNVEAAELFLMGKPLRSIYRVLARDGHTVWFQCEAKMVRTEDGRPWFIHGVAFDITEMKQAEAELQLAHNELEERVHQRTAELERVNQELYVEIAERKRAEEERTRLLVREQEARREAEQANRSKDEFLAVVSHELRTPLTSILGWARMLRTGDLDAATASRAIETIERNAKAQAQLIEDLLDVSRIITGKLRLDVRPLEPSSVIRAALDAVRPAAEARDIRLQSVLDPGAGPVSGDPERLQQIVWNLLSNAIKFTPRGGHVQIRLERVNSHIEIIITDSGEGISPDFLPYIFDRFRQADSSSTRPHGGLGLGLSIVRHLVEMHGGTIWAESPGIGLGTTFTIQLPRIGVRGVDHAPEADRVHPTAEEYTPPPTTPRLDGIALLVVDDEADTLEILVTVLERKGAEVKSARSAAAALEILEGWTPDLLISDIGMPIEDGYSLIVKVRQLQQHSRLPALALTAHARAEDRMRVLSAGFQMHLAKPVEPAELVIVVASMVGSRGTR